MQTVQPTLKPVYVCKEYMQTLQPALKPVYVCAEHVQTVRPTHAKRVHANVKDCVEASARVYLLWAHNIAAVGTLSRAQNECLPCLLCLALPRLTFCVASSIKHDQTKSSPVTCITLCKVHHHDGRASHLK
jgi:hypothetical protein